MGLQPWRKVARSNPAQLIASSLMLAMDSDEEAIGLKGNEEAPRVLCVMSRGWSTDASGASSKLNA